MSAQPCRAAQMPAVVKSGAAGSAQFAGSDSRNYNYFEPEGPQGDALRGHDGRCSAGPERYLLQDWIISFRRRHADLLQGLDGGEELRLAQIPRCRPGMGAHALPAPVDDLRHGAEHHRERPAAPGAPQRFDQAWVKILQNHLGAYKHAEFGLGTSTMQAQRYGYTQMVNNAILTNSSYKLRFAQDHHALSERDRLSTSRASTSTPASSTGSRIRSGRACASRSRSIMGSNDYLEQYFATNVVFEPLVGELFRSGFLMQAAAAQNDFITPAVVSAAEGDYERNLANTVELFHLLGEDPTHGDA